MQTLKDLDADDEPVSLSKVKDAAEPPEIDVGGDPGGPSHVFVPSGDRGSSARYP